MLNDYSDTFSLVAKITSIRILISLAASHQRKYVLDLIFKTRKLRAKPCSSPMVPNLQLTKADMLFDDPARYRRVVGKFNYLRGTRPNIAYSVSVVSRYISSPIVDNWKAVEQILCYLKEAPRL